MSALTRVGEHVPTAHTALHALERSRSPGLSPAPRERGAVGAAAGRGEQGDQLGLPRERGWEETGEYGGGKWRGDNGTGASQAGLTIGWSHTGRCYAWQGRAGELIGLPRLGEGQ